jgi:hypothetical protein
MAIAAPQWGQNAWPLTIGLAQRGQGRKLAGSDLEAFFWCCCEAVNCFR